MSTSLSCILWIWLGQTTVNICHVDWWLLIAQELNKAQITQSLWYVVPKQIIKTCSGNRHTPSFTFSRCSYSIAFLLSQLRHQQSHYPSDEPPLIITQITGTKVFSCCCFFTVKNEAPKQTIQLHLEESFLPSFVSFSHAVQLLSVIELFNIPHNPTVT